MNFQVHDILSNPALLKDVPDELLQSWIQQYPYVSLFHLYALKRKNNYTEKDLHKTAFYFNNREKLYFLLNNKNEKLAVSATEITQNETGQNGLNLSQDKDIAFHKENEIPEEPVKNESIQMESAEEHIQLVEQLPLSISIPIDFQETTEDIFPEEHPLLMVPEDIKIVEDHIIPDKIVPAAELIADDLSIKETEHEIKSDEPMSVADQVIAEIKKIQEERAQRKRDIESGVYVEQPYISPVAIEETAELPPVEVETEHNKLPEDLQDEIEDEIVVVQEEEIVKPENKNEIEDEDASSTKQAQELPVEENEIEAETHPETERIIEDKSTIEHKEIVEPQPEEKKLSIAERVISAIQRIKEERAQRKQEDAQTTVAATIQQEEINKQDDALSSLLPYPETQTEHATELVEDIANSAQTADTDTDALADIYKPIHTNFEDEKNEIVNENVSKNETEEEPVDVDDLADANLPVPPEFKLHDKYEDDKESEKEIQQTSEQTTISTEEIKEPEEKEEAHIDEQKKETALVEDAGKNGEQEKDQQSSEQTTTSTEEIKESEEIEETHIDEQKKETALVEDEGKNDKQETDQHSSEQTTTASEEIKQPEEKEEVHIDEQEKETALIEDAQQEKQNVDQHPTQEIESADKPQQLTSQEQEITETAEVEQARIDEQKKENAATEDATVLNKETIADAHAKDQQEQQHATEIVELHSVAQMEEHDDPEKMINEPEPQIQLEEIKILPATKTVIPSTDEPHTFIEWLQMLDGKLQVQTTEPSHDIKNEKEWIEIPRYEVSMQQEIKKEQQTPSPTEETFQAKKQMDEKKLFEPNFEEGEVDLFHEIDEEVNKVASDSVRFKQDMMTETLAKIYLKQGKPEKALEIYNALLLKFPEKSAYFAALIQKIEKSE